MTGGGVGDGLSGGSVLRADQNLIAGPRCVIYMRQRQP